MVRAIAIVLFLMFAAGPVWAAEAESFNPDAPFQQGLTTSLLRSLLNQAFDRLEDHIEILGKLDPGDVKGDREGRLQFKFYPEGKSKSDQHLGACLLYNLTLPTIRLV
jgi:hypothetical protein